MAVEPSSGQSKILLLANAIADKIISLITVHNADSSAHSTILTNYIQKSSTSGLVKNDGSIDTTSYLSSLPSHTHTSYDSGWQEVTFKSGYSRYNNSTSVYIRRKGDCVELTGVWKPTKTQSAASNPVAFASIPDELKPTKMINVICPGIGKHTYRLTVDGDANLKWSQYGTNASIDLKDSYFAHVHCTWTI